MILWNNDRNDCRNTVITKDAKWVSKLSIKLQTLDLTDRAETIPLTTRLLY